MIKVCDLFALYKRLEDQQLKRGSIKRIIIIKKKLKIEKKRIGNHSWNKGMIMVVVGWESNMILRCRVDKNIICKK